MLNCKELKDSLGAIPHHKSYYDKIHRQKYPELFQHYDEIRNRYPEDFNVILLEVHIERLIHNKIF